MSAALNSIDDNSVAELPWGVARTLSTVPFRQALYRIRFAELALLRKHLKPTHSVLEVGGSTGFQQHFLRRWCKEVISIDIASREKSESFAPVLEYDGTNIPFGDQRFDIVCSSLTLPMLEDAVELPKLLKEMARVLRDDGRTIHLVPNPTWSVWSSLVHPLFMLERAVRRVLSKPLAAPPSTATTSTARGEHRSIRDLRLFFRAPIGVRRSILHECLSYRRAAWVSAFERSGFKVLAYEPGGMFYTGQLRFGGLPLNVRRALSYFLGSSISVLVARKDQTESSSALKPSGDVV